MTPSNIETLLIIMGVLSVTGMSLIGLKIVVNAWLRRKELAGGTELDRLSEAVESIRTDHEALKAHLTGEVTDLQERLDFAERLLTRAESPRPLGPPARDDRTPT